MTEPVAAPGGATGGGAPSPDTDSYIFNPNDPSFQAFINGWGPYQVAQLDPEDLGMAPEAIAAARAEARTLAVEQTVEAYVSAGSPEAGVQAAARAAMDSATGPNARLLGTDAHSILNQAIKQLEAAGEPVHSEVSYLDGEIVRYGTPGSVRVDVLIGSEDAPTEAFDMKTGTSGLSASRLRQILSELPDTARHIPVKQVP